MKYRVWCHNKNEWEKDTVSMLPNGTLIHPYCKVLKKETHTVEFSTGLMDKNGMEIYEGDIIRYSGHYLGDNYEKEYIGVVEWDSETASYPWKLTDTGFMDGPEWREIIGNIHENPGLLEKK